MFTLILLETCPGEPKDLTPNNGGINDAESKLNVSTDNPAIFTPQNDVETFMGTEFQLRSLPNEPTRPEVTLTVTTDEKEDVVIKVNLFSWVHKWL